MLLPSLNVRRFNSTMVRLKEASREAEACFNSTMVRLKADRWSGSGS